MLTDYFGNYIRSLNLNEMNILELEREYDKRTLYSDLKIEENFINNIHLNFNTRKGKTKDYTLFHQLLFRNSVIRNKVKLLSIEGAGYGDTTISDILSCNPIFFNLEALSVYFLNNTHVDSLSSYRFNLLKNIKFMRLEAEKEQHYNQKALQSIIAKAQKLEYLAINKKYLPSMMLKHLFIIDPFTFIDNFGRTNTLCNTLKIPLDNSIEYLQVFYKLPLIWREEINTREKLLKDTKKLSKRAFFKKYKYDQVISDETAQDIYKELSLINIDIEEFKKILAKTQKNLKEFQIHFIS